MLAMSAPSGREIRRGVTGAPISQHRRANNFEKEPSMDFATLLQKISTGAQIAQAITPTVKQYSADHVAATQEVLQVVGAGVAAESNDTTVQQESMAAAQLASSLVPLAFTLFALFKKTPAPAAAAKP
jgi:hypothetical protein